MIDTARALVKRKIEDLRWWLTPNELLVKIFGADVKTDALLERMDRVEAITAEFYTGTIEERTK